MATWKTFGQQDTRHGVWAETPNGYAEIASGQSDDEVLVTLELRNRPPRQRTFTTMEEAKRLIGYELDSQVFALTVRRQEQERQTSGGWRKAIGKFLLVVCLGIPCALWVFQALAGPFLGIGVLLGIIIWQLDKIENRVQKGGA